MNVLGGLNVFDVARDLGLERVVFASSKANYGALSGDYGPPPYKPVTEDYVGQTSNVYGATKKASRTPRSTTAACSGSIWSRCGWARPTVRAKAAVPTRGIRG